MIDMTQMSHLCLASECSRNNFELLEREPCLLAELVLPLGVFGTAPCSKTYSYALAGYASAVLSLPSVTGLRVTLTAVNYD